jgi:hypothetical protein
MKVLLKDLKLDLIGFVSIANTGTLIKKPNVKSVVQNVPREKK